MAAIFSKAEKLVPKSEAQILKETAEEKESGVLMYYSRTVYSNGEYNAGFWVRLAAYVIDSVIVASFFWTSR